MKNSISTNAFSIFVRDIFLTVSVLINGILIGRFLGPEYFGYWTILLLIPSYAEAFGRTKIDLAAVYFISKNNRNSNSILNTINSAGFIFSIIILVLFFLFFDIIYEGIFSNSESNLQFELALISFQFPFQVFFLNYCYYFLALEKIKIYNQMVIIKAISFTLLLLILLLYKLSLTGVIISFTLSTIIGFLFGFIKSNNGFFLFRFNFNEFKLLFKYSLHLYVSGLLSHFSELASRTIAVFFISPVLVGFLGLGQSVSRLLNRVNDALNQILYSKVSKLELKSAQDISAKSFRTILLILILLSLVFLILVDQFIEITYGLEFKEAGLVAKIILPGVVLFGASSIFLSFFNGIGKANVIPKVQIIPLILQIIITTLLTKYFLLIGAALGYSIGLLLYSTFLILKYLNFTKKNLSELFPGKEEFIFIKELITEKINFYK
tara:strand:- start:1956 stop:3266 length:1311 start_codon:yes stop_codon:yes gene_type:complete